MSAPTRSTPRYVAFSTIDDEPWEADAAAARLLDRVRELAALGIGLVRSSEILDCGAAASDVLDQGTTLAEARSRFPTVFRGGDCGPGLPALDLTDGMDPGPPRSASEP